MELEYSIERYRKDSKNIFNFTNKPVNLLELDNPINGLFENYDVYRVIINFGFKGIFKFIEHDPVYFIKKMNENKIDIYNIDINDWIYLVNIFPRLHKSIYSDIISKGNYNKYEHILFKKSIKEQVDLVTGIDIINSIWD